MRLNQVIARIAKQMCRAERAKAANVQLAYGNSYLQKLMAECNALIFKHHAPTTSQRENVSQPISSL